MRQSRQAAHHAFHVRACGLHPSESQCVSKYRTKDETWYQHAGLGGVVGYRWLQVQDSLILLLCGSVPDLLTGAHHLLLWIEETVLCSMQAGPK